MPWHAYWDADENGRRGLRLALGMKWDACTLIWSDNLETVHRDAVVAGTVSTEVWVSEPHP